MGSMEEQRLAVGEDVATEKGARLGAGCCILSRRHRVGSIGERELAVGESLRGLLGQQ